MTNQYRWSRITGPDPNLRAGDADRERIADRLRKSHSDGRLDLNEFQERLERCYEAKTIGELRVLVRDLPRQDVQERRHGLARLRAGGWHLPLLAILVALVVVVASTAHGHGHGLGWLWIPLLFLFWRLSWWRRRRPWAGPPHRSDDWT